MSAPPRRRNPVITRGKKSDRRKQKLNSRKEKSQSTNVGFDKINELANEKRKQILKGNYSPDDFAFLSEPPSLFFEKTDSIRIRQKDSSGTAILLKEPEYEQGVPTDKVKQERIRVIKGQKSMVFHGLKKQFNQHKAKVKQEARKTDPEVIEKARKREEHNRAKAAEEAERKRIAKETERARVLAEERKKEHAANIARLHLERLQEVSRQMAIHEEKLNSEQASQELSRKREQKHSQMRASQQIKLDSEKMDVTKSENGEDIFESHTSTEVEEYGQLGTDVPKTIDFVENKTETLPVSEIERPHERNLSTSKKEKMKSISERKTSHHMKGSFWVKVWNMARKLLPSRSTSRMSLENEANQFGGVVQNQSGEIQNTTFKKKQGDKQVSGLEVKTDLSYSLVNKKLGSEGRVDHKEPVEEVESQEPEAATIEETEVMASEVDQHFEEVESQEPEAATIEETEDMAPEIDESVGEIDISEKEWQSEPNGELDEKNEENEEEELPEIETGEIILADLRLRMQQEPQPIKFITRLLIDRHKLSRKSVNRLFGHVASPFSICKTMDAKDFQRFIDSLNNQEVSGGQDIWTKIIEIIGPNSISTEQQLEIYNLFMGDQKKTTRRVKTVAILYHFLPARFDRWWEKEMILPPVSRKYSNDYDYFEEIDCTSESIEDARMLLCACALEKPTAIANEFTYSKHLAGETHESDTEKWLNRGGRKIDYITQNQIPEFAGKRYGSKHVSPTVTPDILLKDPIQLTKDGQHIHWIDAKNHFIDPALSPENLINDFCGQLEKYVRRYGPGLIVWGKKFSEEWNEATEGVVQHIKI
ncbi:TPD domain-containing protein [Candidatus Poseidoniaceae archaeon]|nr:TPD domain-containing protein [Candidatus Poseidoniaceae archaeon]